VPPPSSGPRPIDIALLISVFVVAACGLLYELAAGALASYVLGDSVLQFSTIIGTYLFAMGLGSWLSRYFERQLPAHFLRIELLVALIGGALPATLFLANAYAPGAFRFLLYGMVLVVGTLVGLEIPLVMRILKRNVVLKDLVSQVLTFDYLGALAVSLAFPLLLVPHLGLIRTVLLFGLMMYHTRPGLSALDYGIQSSLFIIGRTVVPMLAGVLLDLGGYPGMLAGLTVGLALVLLLVGLVRDRIFMGA